MIKKRKIPVNKKLKTSFLCKFLLFLGILLLIIVAFFKVIALFIDKESQGLLGTIYNLSQSSFMDSTIAFSIIFLGVGIILYFFNCQFAKLAEIAEEIENENKI